VRDFGRSFSSVSTFIEMSPLINDANWLSSTSSPPYVFWRSQFSRFASTEMVEVSGIEPVAIRAKERRTHEHVPP
jgi:hypothetical protein